MLSLLFTITTAAEELGEEEAWITIEILGAELVLGEADFNFSPTEPVALLLGATLIEVPSARRRDGDSERESDRTNELVSDFDSDEVLLSETLGDPDLVDERVTEEVLDMVGSEDSLLDPVRDCVLVRDGVTVSAVSEGE